MTTLRDNLEVVSDDLWLEQKQDVVFLYAIDFQELHNFMYPFWTQDPTRSREEKRKFSPDDALASEIVSHPDMKFLVLHGTYMELWHHLTGVAGKLGSFRELSLRLSAEGMNYPLLDLLNTFGITDTSTDPQLPTILQRIVETVAVYEDTFRRLAEFLGNRVTSLDGFFDKKPFTYPLAQFDSAYKDLMKLRAEPRDVRKNEADARNLTALVGLNEYFREGFEEGTFDRRYIVRLFTHTGPLYEISERPDEYSLNLSYFVGGRTVPLLVTPRLIRAKQIATRKGANWATFENLVDLQGQLTKAVNNFDIFTWHFMGEGKALGDVRDMLVQHGGEIPFPAGLATHRVSGIIKRMARTAKDPLITELIRDFGRLAAIGRASHSQLGRGQSVPVAEVVSAANRVCDQIDTIRNVLQRKNPLAESTRRRVPIHPKGGAGFGRKGIFLAENLGYVRAKDGVHNQKLNRLEHRLESKHGHFVLAIDLYQDYYIISWPTSCTIDRFARVVFDLLEKHRYQIIGENVDTELEGVAVMEPSGEITTGPLVLPITESSGLKASVIPVVLRVNARQAAFVCETATPVGRPLTGMTGTPDTVEYILQLYEGCDGLLPAATLVTEIAQIKQEFGIRT